MQTSLIESLRASPQGQEAESILRTCVHCGFCNATCPTYQEAGDELDGPRGRIYLIKQMLEGADVSARTRRHLDRCLTCLNCETTCPSGVRYGHLLETGRSVLEQRLPRPALQRLVRRLIPAVLTRRWLVGPLVALGRLAAPLMPRTLTRQLGPGAAGPAPAPGPHARHVLLHAGCVQPVFAPGINRAAIRVLDRLGIAARESADEGCCGAMSFHLGDESAARRFARRNIDAWFAQLDAGAEAVVSTASGCGAFLKEYDRLLRDDPRYAERARQVAAKVRDLSEVVTPEAAATLAPSAGHARVAVHCPCTLQHAQGLRGRMDQLLSAAGFELARTEEPHLCCGSAGTYSILQPRMSRRLRDRKLGALQGDAPAAIATANIGCLLHLRSGAERPVRHWIEMLDEGTTDDRES